MRGGFAAREQIRCAQACLTCLPCGPPSRVATSSFIWPRAYLRAVKPDDAKPGATMIVYGLWARGTSSMPHSRPVFRRFCTPESYSYTPTEGTIGWMRQSRLNLHLFCSRLWMPRRKFSGSRKPETAESFCEWVVFTDRRLPPQSKCSTSLDMVLRCFSAVRKHTSRSSG